MHHGVDSDERKETSIAKTILGVPLALIVWGIVYVASHIALYLLDLSRGLADDWIQTLFREWFTPGVGGFVAIATVGTFVRGANLRWVAVSFCSPIVLVYIGVSLIIMIGYGERFEYSIGEQLTQWGTALATCIGAAIGVRKYERHSA